MGEKTAMNAAVASSWQTLENVEVECTHCGVRMTRTWAADSG